MRGLPACYGDLVESVHFYGAEAYGSTKIDFGRVPQEVMIAGWNLEPKRGGTAYGTSFPDAFESDYLESEDDAGDTVWGSDSQDFAKWNPYMDTGRPDPKWHDLHRARNLESEGKFKAALEAYAALAKNEATQSFVQDRREILVDKGLGRSTKGLQEYLRLTYLMEFGTGMWEPSVKALAKLEVDPRLKPNWEYQLAVAGVGKPQFDQAAQFQAVAKAYPSDPRAESAYVMAGRTYDAGPFGELDDAAKVRWQKRLQVFDELLAKYPRTRFRWSVYGWRGGWLVRQGQVEAAMGEYQKQSRSPIPLQAFRGHRDLALLAARDGRRAAAARHYLQARVLDVSWPRKGDVTLKLRQTFRDLKAAEVRQMQAEVSRDPELLRSYMDFRLEYTKLEPADERHLLRFASQSLQKMRKADPGVLARVAQLSYNVGDYRAALATAQRVGRASKDIWGRARFAEAGSLARLGRPHEAMTLYSRLFADSPAEYLRVASGEALALLEEKYGDPVRAFHIYRDIGYLRDVAFMADSGLSIPQLKRAIVRYKGAERKSFDYALAMRYFRKEQYAEATAILKKLDFATRAHKGADREMSEADWEFPDKDFAPKQGEIGPPCPEDALSHVRDMAKLRAEAESAKDQERRAAALYALGTYVYDHGDLLFYSAGLWRLARADTYVLYWNGNVNKGESHRKAVATGHEHERFSQAIRLYEELVARCPRSSYVAKALYMAAVCCEKFSRMNTWWRANSLPERKKASRYMQRVATEYPHHELAKAAAKFAQEFKYLTNPDFARDY